MRVWEEDPIGCVCEKHTTLIQAEQVEDVLMSQRHLHLPGIEEAEAPASLLLQLADDSDRRCLVSANLRQKLVSAAGALHDHDWSAANFIKKYKSRFGWMRYPQAARVTEDSRPLYLLTKMLQHHPPCSRFSSPSKLASSIRGQDKRILDRVRDDPILGNLNIPLPNINNKSISNFFRRE